MSTEKIYLTGFELGHLAAGGRDMHGRGGLAYQGGVHGRGHAWWGHGWQGACMAGGMDGRGMHGAGCAWHPHHPHPPPHKQILPDTVKQSMSGRYASYWNAFLFFKFFRNSLFNTSPRLHHIINTTKIVVNSPNYDEWKKMNI